MGHLVQQAFSISLCCITVSLFPLFYLINHLFFNLQNLHTSDLKIRFGIKKETQNLKERTEMNGQNDLLQKLRVLCRQHGDYMLSPSINDAISHDLVAFNTFLETKSHTSIKNDLDSHPFISLVKYSTIVDTCTITVMNSMVPYCYYDVFSIIKTMYNRTSDVNDEQLYMLCKDACCAGIPKGVYIVRLDSTTSMMLIVNRNVSR